MSDTYHLYGKTNTCVRPLRSGVCWPTIVVILVCFTVFPDDVSSAAVITNNGVTSDTAMHLSTRTPGQYRCMYCKSAEHILDCLGVMTCGVHEVCYIEKEMSPAGWPVINAGCRSRHECNLRTCFGESMHGYQASSGKRSRGPLSCHHCCEGEFCNLYGCPDSEDIATLPSTRCLGCDAVMDPIFCDKMINCPYSQQCVSYGVFHAGGLRFELGCEESLYCSAFKNNSRITREVVHHDGEIDLASSCCDNHLCNRNWPPVDAPLPRTVSGFSCNPAVTNSTPNSTLPYTISQTQKPTVPHYTPSSPPMGTKTTLESPPTTKLTTKPSTATTTHDTNVTTTTIPSFILDSSQNTSTSCKNRATIKNCDNLNRTYQLCDAITLSSAYYCAKFCGFCSDDPSILTSLTRQTATLTSTPSTSTTRQTMPTLRLPTLTGDSILIGKRHQSKNIRWPV